MPTSPINLSPLYYPPSRERLQPESAIIDYTIQNVGTENTNYTVTEVDADGSPLDYSWVSLDTGDPGLVSGTVNAGTDAPIPVGIDSGTVDVGDRTAYLKFSDTCNPANEHMRRINLFVYMPPLGLNALIEEDWDDGNWDGTATVPLTWVSPAPPVADVTLDTDGGMGRMNCNVSGGGGGAAIVTNVSFNASGDLPVRVKLDNIRHSTGASDPRFRLYVSNMQPGDRLDTAPDLLAGRSGFMIRARDGLGIALNTFHDTTFDDAGVFVTAWSDGWNIDFTINSFSGENNVDFDAPVDQTVTIDFASLGLTLGEDYRITLWEYISNEAPPQWATFDNFLVTANGVTIMDDDWNDGNWGGGPATSLTWASPPANAPTLNLDTIGGKGQMTDSGYQVSHCTGISNVSINLSTDCPVYVALEGVDTSSDHGSNPRFRLALTNEQPTPTSMATYPDANGAGLYLPRARRDHLYIDTWEAASSSWMTYADEDWSDNYDIDFTIQSYSGSDNVRVNAPSALAGDYTIAFPTAKDEELYLVLYAYNRDGSPIPASTTFDNLRVETHQCKGPFADADGDGDVDQGDFAVFQRCHTGAGLGPVPDDPHYCRCFDRRIEGGLPGRDGDIDALDFAAFEACVSGPAVPADATCGE